MSIIPPVNMSKKEDESILEELLKGRAGAEDDSDKNGQKGSFSIIEKSDRYLMGGLAKPFGAGTVSLAISKNLLDNSKLHTQQEWQDNPGYRALNGTLFEVPSGPEYTSILLGLYAHKDESAHKEKVEAIRALLKDDFDKYWMTTSTRIAYTAGNQPSLVGRVKGRSASSVKDVVIHNYRRNEHKIDANIVGDSGWLVSGMEDELYALTGCRDVALYSSVVEWCTGKKPYLWRLNSNPSNTEVRALVFGVVSLNWFVVDASDSVNDGWPARGVAVVDAKKVP